MNIFNTINKGLAALRSGSEADYFRFLARPDFDSLDEADAIKFARIMRDLGKSNEDAARDHRAIGIAVSHISILANSIEVQVEADVAAKKLEVARARHAAEHARIEAELDVAIRANAAAAGAVSARVEIVAQIARAKRETPAVLAAAEEVSDKAAVAGMRGALSACGPGGQRLHSVQETLVRVEKILEAEKLAAPVASPAGAARNPSPAEVERLDAEARASGQRGLMVTGRGKQATLGGLG